jgi:hypothetical protein
MTLPAPTGSGLCQPWLLAPDQTVPVRATFATEASGNDCYHSIRIVGLPVRYLKTLSPCQLLRPSGLPVLCNFFTGLPKVLLPQGSCALIYFAILLFSTRLARYILSKCIHFTFDVIVCNLPLSSQILFPIHFTYSEAYT